MQKENSMMKETEKKHSAAAIRFFDITFALFLLPFAVAAFVMILVPQLLCFRGVFYVSTRVGQGGRKFTHVKLKSMRTNLPGSVLQGGGRAHMETRRIPLWGRVLRKTHLDEMPEILYILAGQESFVGPRPLLLEHISLADSRERQALKPGWTGYSQVFLKTRGILPSRLQRRLDQKLGRELNPALYLKLLCATLFARKRKPLNPGPTVIAYRIKITMIVSIFFMVAVFPAAADEKRDLEILRAAYPDAFEIVPNGILFTDGTFIVYDDGGKKDFSALLDCPDLEDMLSLTYPLGRQENPPFMNVDPGRFRTDLFFRALYGKTEAAIRANLKPVRWMPSQNGPMLLITACFGVDKKLESVIAELEKLGPEYHRYLLNPGGTFNYRPIERANRLSPHSYGIAVDIAVPPSHYWLWEAKKALEYKNSIPYEIVEIFEKHGFIWGGKWYHFDTMHFEYRPELLLKSQNPD